MECPILRIGLSGFSPLDHYRLGQCIAQAVDTLGRKAVFIASLEPDCFFPYAQVDVVQFPEDLDGDQIAELRFCYRFLLKCLHLRNV